MDTRALWHVGPGRAELRAGAEGTGEVLVETLWTGISRGTERLVSEGRVPEGEHDRMRCPFQEGDFPFPVKYGYCNVGVVRAGPEGLAGRTVFSLFPHQAAFRIPADRVTVLPAGLPPRRAILAANMETALNALWDAELAEGAEVAVIGAGLVGCLTGYLATHHFGCAVTVLDVIEDRRPTANELGVKYATDPETVSPCATVFHTSATARGLATGLDLLGFEGTLVEMSWHGAEPVPVPLGGAFHSRRLRIISSQVGHVARSRRATTSYADRLAIALALLDDPRLDALITGEVAFTDLAAALPRLLARDAPGIATAVRFGAEA